MSFRLAMVQINARVGALEENVAALLSAAAAARQAGVDLAVFPEMILTGYPPEDLLHKPLFLQRLREVEEYLREQTARIGIDLVYGTVRHTATGLGNAAVLLMAGVERGMTIKWWLPNYGVFDERRYFDPGRQVSSWWYRGVKIGIAICEDLWHSGEPVSTLTEQGAQLLIALNASPFHAGKQAERESLVRSRVRETGLPLVYVNLVGGQDELVFDGGSFAMDSQGALVARGPGFRPGITVLEVTSGGGGGVGLAAVPGSLLPVGCASWEEEVYEALLLGVGDYVRKNGFRGVVLGLSGGVDSALTAAICVDALGREAVEALMMPSRFTALASREDASEVARRLGFRLGEVAIDGLFQQFQSALAAEFAGWPEDVTEENLQSRIRGVVLMALSNKKGLLLVTTGNKSELSTGYATLYGDMAGGLAVLKDLYKEGVYRLAVARNRWAERRGEEPPIPERVLTRPPTAELRFDQQDSDTLPPYPVLDRILRLYVEEEMGVTEMVAQGIDREVVTRVVRMVDRNEYKRRQAAPGIRVTRRAFGKDRRYPITNGFQVV